MKVIFVGINNKPNTKPLCSSTVSGKRKDRIINLLPFDCVKTNLYNVDCEPLKENKRQLATDWVFRIQPEKSDIIVLLGADVHNNYIHTVGNVIKLAHPASIYGHENMDNYVSRAANLINDNVK